MPITPFILDSGKAASAIMKSLGVLAIAKPGISRLPLQRPKRNEPIDLEGEAAELFRKGTRRIALE